MTKYRIEFTRPAARQLAKLSKSIQRRIATKLDALVENPRPRGAVKLTGNESTYRVRTGDYRVVYEVEDSIVTVTVVKVGHHNEIYRDW